MRNQMGSFILGCLVGAVVGVLFAPKPGKETREDIAAWMDENLEQGRESYQAQRERLLKAVDNGREVVAQKGDEVKAKIEEAKERLKDQVEQARATAKEKISDAAAKAQAIAGQGKEEKGAEPAE